MFKTMARFLFLGLLTVEACAAAALQADKPTVNVTGTWRGTTKTYCGVLLLEKGRCGAVQRVTFTLFQDGADVKGTYRCSIGNMVCRNMDDSGPVVSSSVSGSLARLRVVLTNDGSSCLFDGHFQEASAGGSYFCYQGGGLVEQGQWQLARWY